MPYPFPIRPETRKNAEQAVEDAKKEFRFNESLADQIKIIFRRHGVNSDLNIYYKKVQTYIEKIINPEIQYIILHESSNSVGHPYYSQPPAPPRSRRYDYSLLGSDALKERKADLEGIVRKIYGENEVLIRIKSVSISNMLRYVFWVKCDHFRSDNDPESIIIR